MSGTASISGRPNAPLLVTLNGPAAFPGNWQRAENLLQKRPWRRRNEPEARFSNLNLMIP
jgi:hypothetical protein